MYKVLVYRLLSLNRLYLKIIKSDKSKAEKDQGCSMLMNLTGIAGTNFCQALRPDFGVRRSRAALDMV